MIASGRQTTRLWLWLSVVIVGLDQWTKNLVSNRLAPHEVVAVVPGFNLTLVHNTGAAFSFLRDAGGWQRWFFVLLALLVSVVVVVWLRRLPASRHWLAVALVLILGGALGNLWDRLVLGYVIDFIDIYVGAWHWPAFNIADSAITIGAIMLVIDAIWFDQAELTTHSGDGKDG